MESRVLFQHTCSDFSHGSAVRPTTPNAFIHLPLTSTDLTDSLDALKEKVLDAVFQLQSCICQPAAKIKVNGRSYQIIKILGEGGFSFVYLAQDVVSGVSGSCDTDNNW